MSNEKNQAVAGTHAFAGSCDPGKKVQAFA
jgi:hypothetical protein